MQAADPDEVKQAAEALAMLPNTALRADLQRRLADLDSLASELHAAISARDADLYAWCPDPDVEPRSRLARDLTRFDHDDEPAVLNVPSDALQAPRMVNDGRATILATGLLACREDTLETAARVNLAKQRLNATLRALDKRRVTRADVTDDKDRWIDKSLLRYALNQSGRSRLSRFQAVRRIQIETAQPVRASFFWAHLPRRYRTTAGALQAMLEARRERDQRAGADVDVLLALYALPRSQEKALTPETQVIVERPLHVHPRCNLTFAETSGLGVEVRVTRVRRAIVPILYPVDAATPPEVISALLPYAEPAPRRRRADQLIRAPIGLRSVRAYYCAQRSNTHATHPADGENERG